MTETFYEVMRRQGITRRSYLKFCSLTAASLGLGLAPSFAPTIAHALETKPRTPVLWLHGLECTCCTESFIRSAHPLAKDVILSMISLDYDDTIMAAAGHQAEAALEQVMKDYKGNYILAVEGNPPLPAAGRGRHVLPARRQTLRRETEARCQGCDGRHRLGLLRQLGLRAGRQAQPDHRGADQQGHHRQAHRQGAGLPAHRGSDDGRRHLCGNLRQDPRARPPGPPEDVLQPAHPRQVLPPPPLRRGPVRREMGRRRGQGRLLPRRLLPLQDGLQGPDHLQRLQHHALERRRVLPHRFRPRLHRLQRGRLLGQGFLLRPPEQHHRLRNITDFGVEANADKIGLVLAGVTGAAVVAHAAVSAIQRASNRSKTQADNSNKVES